MKRWDRLVDQYMEEYTAAGRAEETIKGVQREMDRWGNWLKNRHPRTKLEEVDADSVVAYLKGRGAFRSKATVYGAVSKMRGMGEFLVRENVWINNPLRWMHGPKLDSRSRMPKRISPAVMQTMWEKAAKHRYGFSRGLWITLLAVFYGTGARRGEVIRLNVSAWCREEGTLLIDGRKTGEERRIPVPPLTYQCLEAYLPKRQNHLEALGRANESALFVNRYGSRLTGGAISRGIQKLTDGTEDSSITLHQFRHTCASDLLEAGVRLPEVQNFLGHQAIGTTMRYLHVADPHLHEAVKVHPINGILSEGGVL
jgi:site-specific recombinase XerD